MKVKFSDIKIYTLENENFKIEFLNLGASIFKFFVKDRNKNFRNIVLSYGKLEDYIENPVYMGAIIGRTAGRIENGILNIGEKTFFLDKNDTKNTLHGGANSISHKIWDVKKYDDSIIFTIKDCKNKNGYPGNAFISVKYLLNKNGLKIEYEASVDEESYLNLTNHSYFNLSGNNKNLIYDDFLKINSDFYVNLDENFIPSKIYPLENSIFSFKNSKRINDFFTKNSEDSMQRKLVNNGIDHPYIFSDDKFLEIYNLESGIKMRVETDSPCVVVYTGNFLENINFKNHSAICFETQEIPNLFSDDRLKIYPTILKKNELYKKFTSYTFEII